MNVSSQTVPISSVDDRRHREALVAAARELRTLGLVAGTVGNVSYRSRDHILITPTRVHPCALEPDELVEVDLARGAHDPRARPSRELPLHLEVYRRRSDVRAVVHTHSPHATAWSYLADPLEPRLEDLDYHRVGEVRTSEPAPAGSTKLARVATVTLGDSAAVLLGRHGVLAVGASLRDAISVAEVIERQAEVSWLLRRQP